MAQLHQNGLFNPLEPSHIYPKRPFVACSSLKLTSTTSTEWCGLGVRLMGMRYRLSGLNSGNWKQDSPLRNPHQGHAGGLEVYRADGDHHSLDGAGGLQSYMYWRLPEFVDLRKLENSRLVLWSLVNNDLNVLHTPTHTCTPTHPVGWVRCQTTEGEIGRASCRERV